MNSKKNDSTYKLSQQGEARRQAMLDELQLEMTRHQNRLAKRRQRARFIGSSTALIALVGLVWFLVAASGGDPGSGNQQMVDVDPDAQHRPDVSLNESLTRFDFAEVHTNRQGVEERHVVTRIFPSKTQMESVSDDDMQELLAASGKPLVLGRVDGELVLIPNKFVSYDETADN